MALVTTLHLHRHSRLALAAPAPRPAPAVTETPPTPARPAKFEFHSDAADSPVSCPLRCIFLPPNDRGLDDL